MANEVPADESERLRAVHVVAILSARGMDARKKIFYTTQEYNMQKFETMK